MTAPAAAANRIAITPQMLMQALLVFVVLAPLAERLHWGAMWVFLASALAIVPLAGLMGEATERLASRLGAGVGGLLNATFGNAAELIIALVALQKGLYDVVKASLTGSIIGNILLVLGVSMLAGGFRREKQKFDRSAAAASSTLLALAALAMLVPAVFHFVAEAEVAHQKLTPGREVDLERTLSLEIAIVLFVSYLLSLLFSLRTHKHLYAGAATEHEHKPIQVGRAIVTLVVATALVAWMSELLVHAVEPASKALGMTEVFVGVIAVAIIGNAAEHSSAILVAMKNKMDLAYHIAVGSSMQIALFVAPVLVFLSFAIGSPMDLVFTTFEVITVVLAVAIVSLVAIDGETNWMEGVLLLAVYLIFAIAFFFLPATVPGV